MARHRVVCYTPAMSLEYKVPFQVLRKEIFAEADILPNELADKVKELCRYTGSLEYKISKERQKIKDLEARIEDLVAII